MGLVFSFADARAARVKAKLCAFASARSPAMVETADAMIDARRIFCRDAVAVLIDRYGCQTRIGYAEITDVSPVLPMAHIIALADWQVADEECAAAEQPEAAIVLPFPINRT
jgi:hypothetical protein